MKSLNTATVHTDANGWTDNSACAREEHSAPVPRAQRGVTQMGPLHHSAISGLSFCPIFSCQVQSISERKKTGLKQTSSKQSPCHLSFPMHTHIPSYTQFTPLTQKAPDSESVVFQWKCSNTQCNSCTSIPWKSWPLLILLILLHFLFSVPASVPSVFYCYSGPCQACLLPAR